MLKLADALLAMRNAAMVELLLHFGAKAKQKDYKAVMDAGPRNNLNAKQHGKRT